MKQYRQYQPSSKNENKPKKKQNWFNKKWIPAKYLILIDLILSEIVIFVVSFSLNTNGHASVLTVLIFAHIIYYGTIFLCILLDKLGFNIFNI